MKFNRIINGDNKRRPELAHSHRAISMAVLQNTAQQPVSRPAQRVGGVEYVYPSGTTWKTNPRVQGVNQQAEGIRVPVWACLEHTVSFQGGLWKGDHQVRFGMQGWQHVTWSESLPVVTATLTEGVVAGTAPWASSLYCVPPAPSTGKV